MGDILNAYIQEPVTEKVWTTLGPEFGKDTSKTAVIVIAFYDLKSAGAAFRSHLARCMAETRNQTRRWGTVLSYPLCCMGTFFVSTTMQMWLCQSFPLKPFSNLDMYLGASCARLGNTMECEHRL